MPGRIPGVEDLLGRVKAKVYVHKAEREFLRGFGSDVVAVDNHATLAIGRLTLTFMHTPGHTPGSQCFLIDGRLVSGDTLFIGSCGRTDLPGSDPAQMYESLTQRLAALPDSTMLFPGHNYGGPSSTIGDEKRDNPFMRFASLGDFLRTMGGGRIARP
jgi:glyoxylase-like metal-dependent hydrolase (beta-lactamase superfamily II)